MTNPFRCTGPTIINVSGGRTSGLMLRRVLDAHDGVLPPDVHAVFQNTGRERAETLDFIAEMERAWGVPITWIERDADAPPRARFRVVTHATASRAGEPFAQVITEHRFLPNGVMRFCTQELKIRPGRDFMRARGHDHWDAMMGLRRDEPDRVARVKAREPGEWDVLCPLYDAGLTVEDVRVFWSAQPFDLTLRSWEGNCDGCYLKGNDALVRIESDRPGSLAWWAEQEKRIGARFKKGRGYKDLIARASLPMLPIDVEDAAPALPCNCTD